MMGALLAKAQFVDHASPQAEWKMVHRLADAAAPSVVRALHRAWWAPEDETMWGRVIERLRSGDANAAVLTVDVEALAQRLQDNVWPLLFKTFLRAGELVTRQARGGGLLSKRAKPRLPIAPAFNATNPRAVEWAEKNAARLVVDVTEATRDGVQAFVTEAFKQQIPPAKLVKQLREVVGLTRRQMETLSRQRDRWIADGLSSDVIQKRIEFAYAKALRYRTWNIARTEVLKASNAGQVAAWGQARSDGLLDAELVKEFIVTPDDRLCPICEPLDGEQRKLDEVFSFGGMNPPVHPSCRCAVGMTTPRGA